MRCLWPACLDLERLSSSPSSPANCFKTRKAIFRVKVKVFREDVINGKVCMPNMKYLSLTLQKLQCLFQLSVSCVNEKICESKKKSYKFLKINTIFLWNTMAPAATKSRKAIFSVKVNVIRKGIINGKVCMPNMKYLSLALQKLQRLFQSSVCCQL